MAIVLTDQPSPSGNDTTGASTYPTGGAVGWASWTPPIGKIVLAVVLNSFTGADVTPTISTNGLTWPVLVSQGFSTGASPVRRLTLFGTLASAPTAAQTAVDFGGTSQTGCLLCLTTADGCNTLGANGASAFRQPLSNFSDSSGTTASVSLGAFGQPTNATFSAAGLNGTDTLVVDATPAGYVLGTQQGYTSPAVTAGAQWVVANDVTPAMTWTTAVRWAMVAVELVAAEGAFTASIEHLVGSGGMSGKRWV